MPVPESFRKKVREVWDNRKWEEPSPTLETDPDKVFNESNEIMGQVFGKNISREQFDEINNGPQAKAMNVITNLHNQIKHLNNSLLNHPSNNSAVDVEANRQMTQPMIKDLTIRTAVGEKESARRAFDLIHAVYQTAHDLVKDDENFQNSYAGMHLKDMVEITIPKLKEEFETHLNEHWE